MTYIVTVILLEQVCSFRQTVGTMMMCIYSTVLNQIAWTRSNSRTFLQYLNNCPPKMKTKVLIFPGLQQQIQNLQNVSKTEPLSFEGGVLTTFLNFHQCQHVFVWKQGQCCQRSRRKRLVLLKWDLGVHAMSGIWTAGLILRGNPHSVDKVEPFVSNKFRQYFLIMNSSLLTVSLCYCFELQTTSTVYTPFLLTEFSNRNQPEICWISTLILSQGYIVSFNSGDYKSADVSRQDNMNILYIHNKSTYILI